jgi:hypothetical protein
MKGVTEDLGRAVDRTRTELLATVALVDQRGTSNAVNRLRKGTAVVYFNQASEAAGQLFRLDQEGLQTMTDQFYRNSRFLDRIAIGASVLAGMAFIAGRDAAFSASALNRRADDGSGPVTRKIDEHLQGIPFGRVKDIHNRIELVS